VEAKAWVIEQIKERLRYYGAFTSIGLDIDSRKLDLPEKTSEISESTEIAAATAIAPERDTDVELLEQIRLDLGECTRCGLHAKRRNIVFGVGNPSADLMFIGEGPGYDEDVQGEPFVGKAGQLLNKIIQAIDMRRDEVYIANVVKCRPPGNRDPEPDEVATCRPFLERQIRSIRPVVICTLGRVAIQALLSTEKPLRVLRGTTIELGDALVVPTYHPAYLLRNPEKKRDCWEDMKLVRRLLHERR
jgi:DNA polymerase